MQPQLLTAQGFRELWSLTKESAQYGNANFGFPFLNNIQVVDTYQCTIITNMALRLGRVKRELEYHQQVVTNHVY
jgi:hypothetical protein